MTRQKKEVSKSASEKQVTTRKTRKDTQFVGGEKVIIIVVLTIYEIEKLS